MGKVRIIGGSLRSRLITFSDKALGLRPTPDRVRETLFNWLQDLSGTNCLDLFAGSGALGIEAISRGAKSVVMLEMNKTVVKDLWHNKEVLQLNNLEVIGQDSLTWLQQNRQYFDIIFLDPPYDSMLLQQCLDTLARNSLTYANTLIYIEYRDEADLALFNILKKAKAGVVKYALVSLRG